MGIVTIGTLMLIDFYFQQRKLENSMIKEVG